MTDYLVVLPQSEAPPDVKGILGEFENNGMALRYSSELPVEGVIQSLDLNIKFSEKHTCWKYNTRSVKPLLSYSSGHSKIVKRGIAKSNLGSVVRKSCQHVVEQSFYEQVKRLQAAGFKDTVIISVQSLVKEIKHGKHEREKERAKKRAFMPYTHKMAHGLKKVGFRYGIEVIFTARNKIGRLCALTNKKDRKRRKNLYKCAVSQAATYSVVKNGIA